MGKSISVNDVKVIVSDHKIKNSINGGENILAVAAIKDGVLIKESVLGSKSRLFYDYDSFELNDEHTAEIKVEKAYFAYHMWHRNFFHFMTELFPNIYYYKTNLLDKGYKLILARRNNLIDECLKIMSIPDDAVIQLYSNRKTCFSVSVFDYLEIEIPYTSTPLQLDAFTELQNFFKNESCKNSPKKLYMSREDVKNEDFNNSANAASRKILNEKEILDDLKKNGYEVHTFGEKTFKEKAALLSNTETIIAPYGGNLLNCCLARGLKQLVIITKREHLACNQVYYNFIKNLLPGVEVIFHFGTQLKSESNPVHSCLIPYSVDINDFKNLLNTYQITKG
jgi:capsular polysaccharide biosynthesis protein